jgi:hypothetical protein
LHYLSKLSPPSTIGNEQDVRFARTDEFISDVTVWAGGVDGSSFVEKSVQLSAAVAELQSNLLRQNKYLLFHMLIAVKNYYILGPQLQPNDGSIFLAQFVESGNR